MDPRLRTCLRQGERAVRLGKNQAAESVYRQAAEQFPDSAEAWLGLSQVASSAAERSQALQRARDLDPGLAAPASESVPANAIENPVSQLDAALAESQNWLEQITTTAMEPFVADPPVETVATPVIEAELPPAVEEETLVCHFHPNTETSLRCNRCSKLICVKCAQKTPVGYRCKECIEEQQDVFYSAQWYDYVLAAVLAIPMAAIAAFITIGIGWLTIFVAPFAGLLIAEGVRLVTRRRRGRWLPLLVSACIVLGTLPLFIFGLLGFVLDPSLITVGLLGEFVWLGLYLLLAITSAFYRVK